MGRIAHFVRLNTEPSVGLYDMDVSSLKNEKTARPVPRDGKRPHRRWHGQSRMVLPGRAPVWDAVIDGDLAVDEHVIDAFRVDTRIFKRIHIADAVFAEHHHVRIHAGHDEALALHAEFERRAGGHLAHGLLKGEQALFPHVTAMNRGKAA